MNQKNRNTLITTETTAEFTQESGEKVYCIIPTHNRKKCISEIIESINRQTYKNCQIVIINDGSTDGTTELLQNLEQENLIILYGDGNLWWGGSVAEGIELVLGIAKETEYVLLLNDDSIIRDNYIEQMVYDSYRHHGATVFSPQYQVGGEYIVMTGFNISFKYKKMYPTNTRDVDATFGRGLLVPISTVRRVGNLKYRLFPHYMGDLEFTARIKEKGFPLVVSEEGRMYTDLTESDQHVRKRGKLATWFHPRSKANIQDRILFFMVRGPLRYRVTTIPVLGLRVLKRFIRDLVSKFVKS